MTLKKTNPHTANFQVDCERRVRKSHQNHGKWQARSPGCLPKPHPTLLHCLILAAAVQFHTSKSSQRHLLERKTRKQNKHFQALLLCLQDINITKMPSALCGAPSCTGRVGFASKSLGKLPTLKCEWTNKARQEPLLC